MTFLTRKANATTITFSSVRIKSNLLFKNVIRMYSIIPTMTYQYRDFPWTFSIYSLARMSWYIRVSQTISSIFICMILSEIVVSVMSSASGGNEAIDTGRAWWARRQHVSGLRYSRSAANTTLGRTAGVGVALSLAVDLKFPEKLYYLRFIVLRRLLLPIYYFPYLIK